jgi:hypothetical protein
VDESTVGMGVDAEVVATDKDGNIKRQPVPVPIWTPGLRFYRLSQACRNLYDAYRNLFLGLEALLDTLCQKDRNEGERAWLLRALSTIAHNAGLQELVPPGTADPAAFIVGTQYDHIRLRLFHAKPSSTRKALDLPHPEEVTSAYERLIRIWRQIAQRCLSIRSGGSGAFTYGGFKMMMDNALSTGLTMYFSEDDSPATKGDTEISPQGRAVVAFDQTVYLSETAPGRVSFTGSLSSEGGRDLPRIYRIGTKVGGSLICVGRITGGVDIAGVDVFESVQTIRLRNVGLPRTVFGEANA